MKGISNRQKTVVRPRETVQKFLIQQKLVRRGKFQVRREGSGKGFGTKVK